MLSDRDPSSQGFLVPSLVPSDSFGFGFSHYSDPVGSDFLVGSYRPQLIASSSATHVCSPLLSRSVPGPISCSAVGSYRPQLIASSSATHVCSPLLSRSLAPISSAILSSSLAVTPHVLTWSYTTLLASSFWRAYYSAHAHTHKKTHTPAYRPNQKPQRKYRHSRVSHRRRMPPL